MSAVLNASTAFGGRRETARRSKTNSDGGTEEIRARR